MSTLRFFENAQDWAAFGEWGSGGKGVLAGDDPGLAGADLTIGKMVGEGSFLHENYQGALNALKEGGYITQEVWQEEIDKKKEAMYRMFSEGLEPNINKFAMLSNSGEFGLNNERWFESGTRAVGEGWDAQREVIQKNADIIQGFPAVSKTFAGEGKPSLTDLAANMRESLNFIWDSREQDEGQLHKGNILAMQFMQEAFLNAAAERSLVSKGYRGFDPESAADAFIKKSGRRACNA